MRSNLHVSAPSSSLLRFLKSQSEGLCLFSTNQRSFIFDHAAPRLYTFPPRSSLRRAVSHPKSISASELEPVTLEANFLKLNSLWPPSPCYTREVKTVFRRHRIRHQGSPAGGAYILQR